MDVEGIPNISDNLCNIVRDMISLTDKVYLHIYQCPEDCLAWLTDSAILTPTN